MQISLERQIFSRVKAFCKDEGLVKRLNESLKRPETERFDAKRTLKTGLSVLDAVHCLLDSKRTMFFLKEIRETIRADARVLEAGIGIGILSFASAVRAKEVVGLEINRSVFAVAEKIKRHLSSKALFRRDMGKLSFYNVDAISLQSDSMFDVLVSENIYTGMFYEKQVQIVNSLRRFLIPEYVAIPERMASFVSLAETSFPKRNYAHKELFVPVEHKPDLRYRALSRSYLYSELDFRKANDKSIVFHGTIRVEKTGIVNSLLISSTVIMPSGKAIEGKNTKFFNNHIIIALRPSIEAKRGDAIRLKLNYEAGDSPSSMKISVRLKGKYNLQHRQPRISSSTAICNSELAGI